MPGLITRPGKLRGSWSRRTPLYRFAPRSSSLTTRAFFTLQTLSPTWTTGGSSKRKGTARGRFSHEEKSASDRCRGCGDSWDDFGGAYASPPGTDGSAFGSAYVKLRAGRRSEE